jgi:hypothetical protein
MLRLDESALCEDGASSIAAEADCHALLMFGDKTVTGLES